MRLCKTKAALSRIFRREHQENFQFTILMFVKPCAVESSRAGLLVHNMDLILYNGQFSCSSRYSQNPLIRTLKGRQKVSVLTGCPY